MIAPAQAVSIARNFHRANIAFASIGWILHALLQVDAIARVKPATRIILLRTNWIRLAARAFVSLCIFIGWMYNPTVFSSLLTKVGISLSPTSQAFLTFPVVPWTSGLFGFGIDAALSFIPWVKNALPPVDDGSK